MDREDTLDRLKSLVHLDVDAVEVYETALRHVDDDDVRRSFEVFMADHRRHAEELTRIIADLGGEPPQHKPDLAGRMAEWLTSVRSMRGTEGALKAMRTAERYHVEKYGDAVGTMWRDEVNAVVESFYGDEERHLAYMERKTSAAVGS